MNNDMFGKCGMTQFVGVGVCDTIGLYIANIDDDLRKQSYFDRGYLYRNSA